MTLIRLAQNSDCKQCELHETANSVCIATEWVRDSLLPNPNTPAVVFIGQNPGYHEDKANRPFVGKSGKMMRGPYLTGIDLRNRAAVYLTNIVRCFTPNNATPGWKKHIMPCYKYTVDDLIEIRNAHWDAEVAVVCIWARSSDAAFRLIFNTDSKQVTQKAAFSRQREQVSIKGVGDFVLFHTFHPSYVVNYNPDAAYGVHGHMQILSDWLAGVSPTISEPVIIDPITPENYKWQ